MDLSFPLPVETDATPLPAFDLAHVLAAVGTVEAATPPSAIGPGWLGEGDWLAPACGSFNAAMADRLAQWGQE